MLFFQRLEATLSRRKVPPFPDAGRRFLAVVSDMANENLQELHPILVGFIQNLIPTQNDVAVRRFIISEICPKLQAVIAPIVPDALVYPHGSCMSGTFLPTSDIDLAVFSRTGHIIPTHLMQHLLDEMPSVITAKNFNPIPTARVPVLKFYGPGDVPIDLTLDEIRGPLNSPTICKLFHDIPCTLPAQLFFKCALRNRELDQPYKGGVSSYTLQLMLVAYVQYAGVPKNVTELIIGFCRFFGFEFNYIMTGIDVSGHGSFFSRVTEPSDVPLNIHIRDPLNPRNILGHNSFRIMDIRQLFRDIYTAFMSGDGTEFLKSLDVELEAIKTMREKGKELLEQNKDTV